MDTAIDMRNPVSRAHWCGTFCCTDAELANAVRVMASTDVGLVALYLATLPQTNRPWTTPARTPAPLINTSR
jgi:hypothetical protein